jgi:hypothetical protein
MNTEKFKGLIGIEEDTEIAITPTGEKVNYGMFLKNPYIFRTALRLNPVGVRVLIFARSCDPFVDASPDTLAELNQPGSRSTLTH